MTKAVIMPDAKPILATSGAIIGKTADAKSDVDEIKKVIIKKTKKPIITTKNRGKLVILLAKPLTTIACMTEVSIAQLISEATTIINATPNSSQNY